MIYNKFKCKCNQVFIKNYMKNITYYSLVSSNSHRKWVKYINEYTPYVKQWKGVKTISTIDIDFIYQIIAFQKVYLTEKDGNLQNYKNPCNLFICHVTILHTFFAGHG